MSALGLSIKVSRSFVAGVTGPLELQDFDGGYEILSAGPGAESVRLITEESDFVDGSVLLGWVRQDTQALIRVRVYGDNQGDLDLKIRAVRKAVQQLHYTVTVTRQNSTQVWVGMPSPVIEGNGGVWDPDLLAVHWQDVTIAMAKHPSG